ncbi:hypothetical protein LSH36_204g03004 [Paralvinella palmiformis]|uniref:Consortin N-terminal domain-containing protein n=1 Tax=Paralvinella palmiformis TaxID=53620 RepID=A0AAD9JQ13_9ANNE|nr:hypothetical protein LSH36_204g03004 [Paralvinella palmiformis]
MVQPSQRKLDQGTCESPLDNTLIMLGGGGITTNSEEFNSLYKIDDCEDKAMTDNINDKDDTYDQTKTENESNISAKLYDGSSGDSHCTDIKQEEEHIENEEHQSNHVKEDSDKMADITEEMIMSEIKPEFMDDVLSDPCLDFLSDPADMTPDIREKTYTLGEELQKKGKNVFALKCYLRCLSGLYGKKIFPHLSQCLRNVAELYYSMGEYDKAVQFIQAEKVYYESELIDSSGIFQLADNNATPIEEGNPEAFTSDQDKDKLDVIRAQEYATLAQLCLDHDQPQMALEYQAKATKLRQKLLGDDHPVTQKSLNAFTIMYAEAGKKQYSESLQKYTKIESEMSTTDKDHLGLRKRKNVGQEEDNGKDMQQVSSGSSDELDDPEIVIPMFIYIILIVLCSVVVIGTIYYINCRDAAGVDICFTGKKLAHYYNRISYMVNKLTKSTQNK